MIGGLAWIGGWVELLVLGPFAGGAVVAALVAYRYVLAAALLVYAALYSPSFFVAALAALEHVWVVLVPVADASARATRAAPLAAPRPHASPLVAHSTAKTFSSNTA